MSSETPFNGVIDVLLKNFKTYQDKPALHWLDKDGNVAEMITYGELEERTLRTAKGLVNLLGHLELNEEKQCVVLCYPPGLEFILTFIACLRAGLVAVPVCPPSKHHSTYTTATLNKITADCSAVFGLTNKDFCEQSIIAELMGTSDIPWHCELVLNDEDKELHHESCDSDQLSCSLVSDEGKYSRLDTTSLDEIIMLQYTSGSTDNPKGVVNTNRSVLQNFELVKAITRTNDQMIELSFLPHYHDFGLFCSYLQTLYCGATGYFMSPTAFIEEPGQWIHCLSKYKATHTQVPNFALELVLRKGYPKDVDLSSLQYVSNGSEPIFPHTIATFEKEFAGAGLRKNTVRAGYGLAEHTVYVCGVYDEDDPLIIEDRISCGKPLPGVIVKVVDPETRSEVKEGEEGEVWVDSGSKAFGYWGKVELTHTVFEAELANSSGRLYLRTGDLGFISRGELFISGRINDVIVLYGRKIHPSDIEMRMESIFQLLRPGRTVACEYSSVSDDGTNITGVAYIAELRSTQPNSLAELESYSMRIAIQMSLQFQINVMLVVLIKYGSMPRTTSGKRQRSFCREKLLEKSLPEVFRWIPSKVTDDTLLTMQTKMALVSPQPTELSLPLETAFKRKESVSDSKGKKAITPTDFVQQFNCDLEGSDTDTLLSPSTPNDEVFEEEPREGSDPLERPFRFEVGMTKDYQTLVSPTVLPKIEISKFELPTRHNSTPLAQVHRTSRVIPAITASSPECPISVKTHSREICLEHSSFLCARDSPRRKSAPPHEVCIEEKRIEDDIRRPSMQDRKVMMVKKDRRNSIQTLTNTISKVLGVEIEANSNIWAFGCNSLKATQLSKSLQLDFGFNIEPHLLYTHQTPIALLENLQHRLLNTPESDNCATMKRDSSTEWKTQSLDRKLTRRRSSFGLLTNKRLMSLPQIYSDDGEESMSTMSTCSLEVTASSEEEMDIAIVGMACSFAGCENTQELWSMLMSKTVATTAHKDPTSNHTYSGGFSSATGRFDHQFFGLTEWEALTLDPQQSMLLHTVWECLQNSGYGNTLNDLRGQEWGVFVGITLDCDAHFHRYKDGTIPPATGITSSIAANRIARIFDFVGPTMSIDTACASSLSALHTACLSLKAEDCAAALVCGVNALLDKYRFTLLENMGMLAPDEKCKVFDKTANGYVRGEGSGAVLLMPLSKARKESRRVLGLIKSTANNNNGALSSTLTAPHTGQQTRVINRAISKSKICSSSIHYIEAHGTGTKLGDPIEIDALESVFGKDEQQTKVYIGSIKANIGHLETGAGIAGLIKTVLVLENAQIPGNPCLHEMNPAFHLSNNISIPSENVTEAFSPTDKASAIVNCFGFGGTNATAVLQQYRALPHMARVKGALLFLTESTAEDLPMISEIIKKLEESFPQFEQLSQKCRDSIENLRINEPTKDIAVFHLFYSIAKLLISLDTSFNIAGGLDILGEILALSLAGALELYQAINFISSYKSRSYPTVNEIQGSIAKPSISIFSNVLEKVCNPAQYETELQSEKYATSFLKMLKGESTKNHLITKALIMMSSQTMDAQPLLTLTTNSISSQIEEIEQTLPDIKMVMSLSEKDCPSDLSYPQYLRQLCMELRAHSDKLELETCIRRPSKGPENILPEFYEKYSLRALVNQIKEPQKMSDLCSIAAEINESGYLTQTASIESVQISLPMSSVNAAPSPLGLHMSSIKAPPPSPSPLGIKLGMKTQAMITESNFKTIREWEHTSKGIQESIQKIDLKDIQRRQKNEVMTAILKLVEDELEDTVMPLDEVAESGIFELGLDSFNVMQLSDFFKKTYSVHLNFTELTELETLGAIAMAVVEQSTVLKQAITDCSLLDH